MIIHSYIGQQPVYSEALKCHIYPAPDYVTPEFMEPSKPKPQAYLSHYAERRGKNYAAIVKWLTEHGPATAKVIGLGLGKSDQAIRCSIDWHTDAFVALGEANDSRHSVIYGLPGQTLDDVTQCLDVEFAYKRIAKFLEENGPSFPGDIAKALNLKNAVVSSALSDYPNLFVKQDKSRSRPIWMRKVA